MAATLAEDEPPITVGAVDTETVFEPIDMEQKESAS